MSAATVTLAIRDIRRGEVVIVTDDDDRENEGDLIMAAESATTEKIAFFLEHTSGVICVAATNDRLEHLGLPLMVADNRESRCTAFTVTVDRATGVTTGISAADRASTIRALADPRAVASDFVRPGHVFPLRARPGGVLERPGHTEAAVDLARLAGCVPVGVLCEVVGAGRAAMAQRADLEILARAHGLSHISIADLIRHRCRVEPAMRVVAEAPVPTPYGTFRCQAWRAPHEEVDHLVFMRGDIAGPEPLLVRVHSECLTGDVLGSLRCDCGTQLQDSLRAIDAAGRGAVIYIRGHEGRGIGIAAKLQAYAMQDEGYDTVEANLQLGLPVDGRDYSVAAQILHATGSVRVRLLTNNPAKCRDLESYGIEIVERVPLPVRATKENIAYLQTKRHRMGHLIAPLEPACPHGSGRADVAGKSFWER